MLFGSMPLAHKADTIKLHYYRSDKELILSKISAFVPTTSRNGAAGRRKSATAASSAGAANRRHSNNNNSAGAGNYHAMINTNNANRFPSPSTISEHVLRPDSGSETDSQYSTVSSIPDYYGHYNNNNINRSSSIILIPSMENLPDKIRKHSQQSIMIDPNFIAFNGGGSSTAGYPVTAVQSGGSDDKNSSSSVVVKSSSMSSGLHCLSPLIQPAVGSGSPISRSMRFRMQKAASLERGHHRQHFNSESLHSSNYDGSPYSMGTRGGGGSRKSQLGIAIILTPPLVSSPQHDIGGGSSLPAYLASASGHVGSASSCNNERFRSFILSHSHLIQSEIDQLERDVHEAAHTRTFFLHRIHHAWEGFKGRLERLYTSPRLLRPVWISLAQSLSSPSTINQAAIEIHANQVLSRRFTQTLADLALQCDTKDKNFFLSNLLTAVLCHHLTWVSSVSPAALVSATNHRNHSKPIPTRRLSSQNGGRLSPTDGTTPFSYNPFLAQLMDIRGQIGCDQKEAQVIITGKQEEQLMDLVTILSYFIRSSTVVDRSDSARVPYHISADQIRCGSQPTPTARSSSSSVNQSATSDHQINQQQRRQQFHQYEQDMGRGFVGINDSFRNHSKTILESSLPEEESGADGPQSSTSVQTLVQFSSSSCSQQQTPVLSQSFASASPMKTTTTTILAHTNKSTSSVEDSPSKVWPTTSGTISRSAYNNPPTNDNNSRPSSLPHKLPEIGEVRPSSEPRSVSPLTVADEKTNTKASSGSRFTVCPVQERRQNHHHHNVHHSSVASRENIAERGIQQGRSSVSPSTSKTRNGNGIIINAIGQQPNNGPRSRPGSPKKRPSFSSHFDDMTERCVVGGGTGGDSPRTSAMVQHQQPSSTTPSPIDKLVQSGSWQQSTINNVSNCLPPSPALPSAVHPSSTTAISCKMRKISLGQQTPEVNNNDDDDDQQKQPTVGIIPFTPVAGTASRSSSSGASIEQQQQQPPPPTMMMMTSSDDESEAAATTNPNSRRPQPLQSTQSTKSTAAKYYPADIPNHERRHSNHNNNGGAPIVAIDDDDDDDGKICETIIVPPLMMTLNRNEDAATFCGAVDDGQIGGIGVGVGVDGNVGRAETSGSSGDGRGGGCSSGCDEDVDMLGDGEPLMFSISSKKRKGGKHSGSIVGDISSSSRNSDSVCSNSSAVSGGGLPSAVTANCLSALAAQRAAAPMSSVDSGIAESEALNLMEISGEDPTVAKDHRATAVVSTQKPSSTADGVGLKTMKNIETNGKQIECSNDQQQEQSESNSKTQEQTLSLHQPPCSSSTTASVNNNPNHLHRKQSEHSQIFMGAQETVLAPSNALILPKTLDPIVHHQDYSLKPADETNATAVGEGNGNPMDKLSGSLIGGIQSEYVSHFTLSAVPSSIVPNVINDVTEGLNNRLLIQQQQKQDGSVINQTIGGVPASCQNLILNSPPSLTSSSVSSSSVHENGSLSSSSNSHGVVCVVGNTDDWTVNIVTGESLLPRGQVYPSLFVTKLVENVSNLVALQSQPDFILSFMEDSLAQLYWQSCSLAEMMTTGADGEEVDMTELCRILSADWSDLSLLFAVASVHSPDVVNSFIV